MDVRLRPTGGGASTTAASILRAGGKLGPASVTRRYLKAECSRYAGRGNAIKDWGCARSGSPGECRCALGVLGPALLSRRGRAGDVEVEGEH